MGKRFWLVELLVLLVSMMELMLMLWMLVLILQQQRQALLEELTSSSPEEQLVPSMVLQLKLAVVLCWSSGQVLDWMHRPSPLQLAVDYMMRDVAMAAVVAS